MASLQQDEGTPIPLLGTKPFWLKCLIVGAVLWFIGLALWWQQGIDESALYAFDAARIANNAVVVLSLWLTTYGMAAISAIFVGYLLLAKRFNAFDAPPTIYLYTIFSMGISGIVGDLLKEVFARPRPFEVFGDELFIAYQSETFAMPSGHTTKSIALVLPFILLIANTNTLNKGVKVIIAVLALGVALSRIVLGVHYVSDVVAGVGMALIGLPFTMMFSNMVLSQSKAEQLPMLSLVWGGLLIALTLLFIAI